MDVRYPMGTQLEELSQRMEKLEKQNNQEVLTLVEILSNATFFGEAKKANCEHSKNGQCSFFIVKSEEKNKIPIVSDCRIGTCKEQSLHCHIELSNITCTLCQKQAIEDKMFFDPFNNNQKKDTSKLIKNIPINSQKKGTRKNE